MLERYVTSVYWAMQTITTVGYGDLQDTTINSQIFSILCMAIGGAARVAELRGPAFTKAPSAGGIMFGHLITSVFNALSPETHERQHQELVSAIMGYLRANNIPLAVSRHVLQHVWNSVPRP